jgi:hypothetical protein
VPDLSPNTTVFFWRRIQALGRRKMLFGITIKSAKLMPDQEA